MESLRAHPLQFLAVKGRVTDIIGEQAQRRAEVRLEREQAEHRFVGVRRAVDLGAEAFLRFGEGDRILARRAFVHQAEHQRLGAERIVRIGGIAGIEAHRDLHRRYRGPAREDDFHSVLQLGAFDRRKFERFEVHHRWKLRTIGDRGRRADTRIGTDVAERRIPVTVGRYRRRRLAFGEGAAAIFTAFGTLAGRVGQRESRTRHPFVGHRLRLLGRNLRQPVELGLVIGGIVRIERAFRQRHRLAAKAADRFQPRNRTAEIAGRGALQFVRGRAGREEIGDLCVELFADDLGIDARLHVGLNDQEACILQRLCERRDADRDRSLRTSALSSRDEDRPPSTAVAICSGTDLDR